MTDELRSFTFGRGSHRTRENGMCIMEAVAMLAGEPHGDAPECADETITSLAILVNDYSDDQLRQELLEGLPYRIVGTRTNDKAITAKRAQMYCEFMLVKAITPLVACYCPSVAAKLLRMVVSKAPDSVLVEVLNHAYTDIHRILLERYKGLPDVDYSPCLAVQSAFQALELRPCDMEEMQRHRTAAALAYTISAFQGSLCGSPAMAESLLRGGVELLDAMIKLTEPVEVVPQRALARA